MPDAYLIEVSGRTAGIVAPLPKQQFQFLFRGTPL